MRSSIFSSCGPTKRRLSTANVAPGATGEFALELPPLGRKPAKERYKVLKPIAPFPLD